MVGFERMILARLMAYLMLVSILVTIDYLLHVTSICTKKMQRKNCRYKWYIVNLCLRHDHKYVIVKTSYLKGHTYIKQIW